MSSTKRSRIVQGSSVCLPASSKIKVQTCPALPILCVIGMDQALDYIACGVRGGSVTTTT